MRRLRSSVPGVLLLGFGVALGWCLASTRPQPLRAGGNDRSGESILMSGPVLVRYNEGTKVQLPQDALYYLDYRGGRLLAAVPSVRSTVGVGAANYLGNFASRDLIADFKLDADSGQRPRFLMTAGSLGPLSDGWAPLFVFETTTNQVGVYRVQQQMIGMVSKPRFELVEVRPIGDDQVPPGASKR